MAKGNQALPGSLRSELLARLQEERQRPSNTAPQAAETRVSDLLPGYTAHNSCPHPRLIEDYVQGQLAGPRRDRLVAHLRGCEACRSYGVQMREVYARPVAPPRPPQVLGLGHVLALSLAGVLVLLGNSSSLDVLALSPPPPLATQAAPPPAATAPAQPATAVVPPAPADLQGVANGTPMGEAAAVDGTNLPPATATSPEMAPLTSEPNGNVGQQLPAAAAAGAPVAAPSPGTPGVAPASALGQPTPLPHGATVLASLGT